MSNTANSDWDEASPAITDPRRQGAAEIRVLRGGVRTRLLKEHTAPATGGVGGEHLSGSGISYVQASAPTLRPDAATPLSSGDKGRLWVDTDTNQIYYWSASAWVLIGDLPITLVDYARWAKGSTNAAGGSVYRRISGSATQSQASTGGWDASTANGVRLSTGTYIYKVEFWVDETSTSQLIGSKVTFSGGLATPASAVHALDTAGISAPVGQMYTMTGRVVIASGTSDFEFYVKADANAAHVCIVTTSTFHFEKIA